MTASVDIAEVVLDFFKGLPAKGKPLHTEATVLAAFVLTDSQSQWTRVVSLATGTKCLGKCQLEEVLENSTY